MNPQTLSKISLSNFQTTKHFLFITFFFSPQTLAYRWMKDFNKHFQQNRQIFFLHKLRLGIRCVAFAFRIFMNFISFVSCGNECWTQLKVREKLLWKIVWKTTSNDNSNKLHLTKKLLIFFSFLLHSSILASIQHKNFKVFFLMSSFFPFSIE